MMRKWRCELEQMRLTPSNSAIVTMRVPLVGRKRIVLQHEETRILSAERA